MQTQNNDPPVAVAFPWSNTRVLADSLRNGDLCLATAIGQFSAVMREGLKIMEDFAREQTKSNLERKIRVEKMDKLIDDLTEKCQAMQQALLYKEEKYDEKCREVERYKVICELSAKAAVNDDLYYGNRDENNNRGENNNSSDFLDELRDELRSQDRDQRAEPPIPPSQANKMASYYIGGPCKRKQNTKFCERLASIGGINALGPRINSGPVSLDRLYRPHNSFAEDQNKRVKVALVGQSNEVMSSSKNAVHHIKQKFTEKDLHRQVAGGCWTRMPSRRKKEWPF